MVTAGSLFRKGRIGRRTPFVTGLLFCISGAIAAYPQQQDGNAPGPAMQTPTPDVQAIPLDQPTAARLGTRKNSESVTVTGSDWADTQLVVAPGDSITFTAKGEVSLNDGRTVTADGSPRGWKDLLRQFPDNSSPVGALVARIGSNAATVPFQIGASKTLEVPSTGELYLRINVSSDLAATGSYVVTIKLSRQPEQTKKQAVAEGKIAAAISPALFTAIPRRVQDQQDNLGDMVNFALVGTQEQVTKAFQNAGWVSVDSTKQDAVLHGFIETLQHKAYLEMPMSTLYLFGRQQDLSYARADPIMVAAERHHLRVWKTTETVNGVPLWVGSSTHDIGFERDQRNNGVTHKIDPEIDKERDFLEQSFAAAGDLQAAAYVTPSDPLKTARTATGGSFQSDGRIVVLILK
ncbi:MAG TPA: LssY C-terminal domain-containing protein [Acidobacteriaceae bacterium]